MIASVSVPYFVINIPNGDTASVERWRFRYPSRVTMMTEVKDPIVPGTRVEVRIRPEISFGVSSVVGWALAEVVQDLGGDHPVEVKFKNSEFWKQGLYPRSEVRISSDTESTCTAWDPPRNLISDREHLIQYKLNAAAELVLQLEQQLETMDGPGFEPHRDTLIEIVEDLLIARYYDKAIVLVRFLRDAETLIAKRCQKQT